MGNVVSQQADPSFKAGSQPQSLQKTHSNCKSRSDTLSSEETLPSFLTGPDNLSSPFSSPLRTPSSSFSFSSSPPCWSHASEDVSSFESRNRKSDPPPAQPLILCERITDSFVFHSDVLDEIEHRRDCFFEQIWGMVRPLLGRKGIENTEDIARMETPSYERLVSQPEGLKGQLKPYQLDGLAFLLYLRENGIGGILGDEMGLGKTIQTLALFQHVKENRDLSSDNTAPFLVVCPLSVVATWASEIAKWTPGLRAIVYHGAPGDKAGTRRQISKLGQWKEGRSQAHDIDVVITTYDSLISDIVWFRRVFVWRYVVLDEGHRIKNEQSKRTQKLEKIRAEFKLVLSGTPIQNDLKELWSILRWLYPKVFSPETARHFEESFVLNEGQVDTNFLDHVKAFLKLVMLRRLKDSREVGLDIPPMRETILSVPLSRMQYSWYMGILTGVDQPVNEDGVSTLSADHGAEPDWQETLWSGDHTWSCSSVQLQPVKEKKRYKIQANTLMELRKCSIHPYMLRAAIPDEDPSGKDLVAVSGKFVVLEKLVRHYLSEGRKMIIFSNFDQALNLCEDMLEVLKSQTSFEYARLDGSTSSAWRRLAVHLFNNDERYMVFLLAIRAGGEGLNLVSSSVVVFLDEDWNPQVMRQAEARVHRIGQTRAVDVFRLHSKGTVEEQMCRRLLKKAYLADRVVEDRALEIPMSPTETSVPLVCDELELSEELSVADISAGDWKSILQKCSVSQLKGPDSPGRPTSSVGEKEWLKRAEGVKTNIFNGAVIDTTSKSWTWDHGSSTTLSRADRRIGKRRVAYVDGWEVLNDNIVFSDKGTTAGIQAPGKHRRTISNELTCFLCKRFDPHPCNLCPRAFHEGCLDLIDAVYHIDKSRICCPAHYCTHCLRCASDSGGLIYCCISCECAYCEKCLDWKKTEFVGVNPAYQVLGHLPGNMFYIRCEKCIEKRNGLFEADRTSVKRPRLS